MFATTFWRIKFKVTVFDLDPAHNRVYSGFRRIKPWIFRDLLGFKLWNSPDVFIYVYLQFKSEFIENHLASTSLKLPLSKNMSSKLTIISLMSSSHVWLLLTFVANTAWISSKRNDVMHIDYCTASYYSQSVRNRFTDNVVSF